MKKICFETDQDGFYGTYYENTEGADCAVIGLFGDDPNDYMAKCGAKWLHKNGVNAFVCLRETITTVMSTVRLRELRQRLRG